MALYFAYYLILFLTFSYSLLGNALIIYAVALAVWRSDSTTTRNNNGAHISGATRSGADTSGAVRTAEPSVIFLRSKKIYILYFINLE